MELEQNRRRKSIIIPEGEIKGSALLLRRPVRRARCHTVQTGRSVCCSPIPPAQDRGRGALAPGRVRAVDRWIDAPMNIPCLLLMDRLFAELLLSFLPSHHFPIETRQDSVDGAGDKQQIHRRRARGLQLTSTNKGATQRRGTISTLSIPIPVTFRAVRPCKVSSFNPFFQSIC